MIVIEIPQSSIIVGMDNNNTIETNMILTDDKEVVIDMEMSKLIYEYVVREQYIGLTRYE